MQSTRLQGLRMGGEKGGEVGERKEWVYSVWMLMKEVRCAVKKLQV